MPASVTYSISMAAMIRNSRELYHVNKPFPQGTAGKGEREGGLKEGIEKKGEKGRCCRLVCPPSLPHILILKVGSCLRKLCLHMLRRDQNSVFHQNMWYLQIRVNSNPYAHSHPYQALPRCPQSWEMSCLTSFPLSSAFSHGWDGQQFST